MEQTRLTIRLPRNLLEGARRYAREHDTTLTRLVAAYFSQLSVRDDFLTNAPIVQRLSGILSQDASVEDYHKHMEEKYGCQA